MQINTVYIGPATSNANNAITSDQLCKITANIWDAVFAGYEDVPWDEIPVHKIDPYNIMSCFILLFIVYKPSRAGGELRDIETVHIWDDNPDYIIINNPSKNNAADTNGDSSKIVHKSVNGKGLFEIYHIVKKLRPVFENDHKHRHVLFLKPAKKVTLRDGKLVGFEKGPIGKNNFTNYYHNCGLLTGVKVSGSIGSVRHIIITTLVKSGINPIEVAKNWTKHTSVAVNEYYQQSIAKEKEIDQQHKFEKFVSKSHDKYNKNFRMIDDVEYKSGDQIAGGQVGGGQVKGGQVAGGQVAGGQVAGGQVAGGQVSGGFNKNTLIQQLLNVNPKHLHLHFS